MLIVYKMEFTAEKRKEIEERFSIESLRENQIQGIKAICTNKDVFVGLKTGSGKSLIYSVREHPYHLS